MRFLSYLLLASALVIGCKKESASSRDDDTPREKRNMKLTSPAFAHNAAIPARHGNANQNVSPPLAWTGAPASTAELALIVDDPDAPDGTFTHWVLYKIPSTVSSLPEGAGKSAALPDGPRQGRNDFDEIGYGGPQPPSGTHHYHFKIYALDKKLDLKPGASKDDLLKAMKGHIVDSGELVGTFSARG